MEKLYFLLFSLLTLTPLCLAGSEADFLNPDTNKNVTSQATEGGLTDDQKRASKTYIDQTKANEVLKEACGDKGCNTALVDQSAVVFDPVFDTMVPMVSTMMTTALGGSSGGKIKMNSYTDEDKANIKKATDNANKTGGGALGGQTGWFFSRLNSYNDAINKAKSCSGVSIDSLLKSVYANPQKDYCKSSAMNGDSGNGTQKSDYTEKCTDMIALIARTSYCCSIGSQVVIPKLDANQVTQANEYLKSKSADPTKYTPIQDTDILTDAKKYITDNYASLYNSDLNLGDTAQKLPKDGSENLTNCSKSQGIDPIARAESMKSFLTTNSEKMQTLFTQLRNQDKFLQAANQADKDLAKAYADANQKSQTNEYDDFCALGPMATEMIGSAVEKYNELVAAQTVSVATSGTDQSYIQRESLVAMKKAHEGKRDSAQLKAAGWSLTGACYGAYLATDMTNGGDGALGIADVSVPMKAAASGFLSFFYTKKVQRHQQAMDLLDKYIAKLPAPGQCNPYTQRGCYCDEEGNITIDANAYAGFCVHADLKNRFTLTNTAPIPCVDSAGALDNNCNCKRTNSCISNRIATQMTTNGFNTSYVDGMSKNLDYVFGGKYDSSKLSSVTNSMNAMAKSRLNEHGSKFKITPTPLTADQQKMANQLISQGVPASISSAVAGTPVSSAGANAASNSLSGSPSSAGMASAQRGNSAATSIVTYGQANGSSSAKGNSFSSSSANPFSNLNPFAQKPANSGPKSGIEVVSFAQRAMERAPQIQNNSSVPIWSIISNRYRNSAWGRFEVDKSVEAAPVSEAPAPAAAPATK